MDKTYILVWGEIRSGKTSLVNKLLNRMGFLPLSTVLCIIELHYSDVERFEVFDGNSFIGEFDYSQINILCNLRNFCVVKFYINDEEIKRLYRKGYVLVDMPGICGWGQNDYPWWYVDSISPKLIIWVNDANHALSSKMLDWVVKNNQNIHSIVVNKSDCIHSMTSSREEVFVKIKERIQRLLPNVNIVFSSAVRDDGNAFVNLINSFITNKMGITQKYNQVIAILENSSLRDYFSKTIDSLRERTNENSGNDIRLGIIGVTSSGKSTLINAFLGEPLLPMEGRPSSSQLVSCRKSKERNAVIHFEDSSFLGKKQEVLTGNKLTAKNLQQYCDESGNAKNKKKVNHIYLNVQNFDFQENLILVDSPGLDAYGLENHEKLTMATLLPTVDFCVFVTTCKSNSDKKMESCLSEFAKHNKPLIIVQNMADSIQPSLDGKKSREDVAADLQRRVRNIINQSSIKDKEAVKIIQISARQALEYRSGVNKSQTDFKNSNYEALRNEIVSTINSFMPDIQNGKVLMFFQNLDEIIVECQNQSKYYQDLLNNTKSDFDVNSSFPYDKSKSELREYRKKMTRQMMADIGSEIREIISYIQERYYISQTELNYVSSSIGNIINKLTDDFDGVYKKLGTELSKFGMNPRDAYGDIYIPKAVKLENQTYRTRSNSCDSCPKYNYHDDYEKNKKDALAKVSELGEQFNNTLTRMGEHFDNIINKKIIPEIDRRKADFENKRKQAEKVKKDKIKLKSNIEEFKSISEALQILRKSVGIANATKPKAVDNVSEGVKDVKLTVPKDFWAISKLAGKIQNGIHRNAMNSFLEHLGKDNNLIVGWDAMCMQSFVFNNFGKDIYSISKLDGVKHLIDSSNYTSVLLNPQPKQISTPIHNLFVLVNLTQIGQAQSQLQRSGVLDIKYDNIILVCQDFREVSKNFKEYLPYLKSGLSKTFKLKHCYYLLNDKNPLLDMAAISKQLGYVKTQTDETELFSLLKEHYGSLFSDRIQNFVSQIVRN